MSVFVMARTVRGRPTLQHRVDSYHATHTHCGLDISFWSKVFQRRAIEVLLCRRCSGVRVSREEAAAA